MAPGMERMTRWARPLRVVVEGAVIVGSILLAFGIDAWWEGVKDRREEILVLNALQAEFRQNLGELRSVHRIHQVYSTELDQLVTLMSSTPDGGTVQVPDSLLRPLVSFRTADPAMGTLNTLLASGRIGLIENQGLQRALAGWPAVVDDVAEDESLIRDFVHERLIAGLVEEVDVGRMLAAWGSLASSGRAERTLGASELPLRVTPHSRALIGQRHHLARILVGQSQGRLDAGDSILALIDRDLAGR